MSESKITPSAVQALLDHRTPTLSAAELRSFVHRFVEDRQRYLAPLSQHASPLYLFDGDALTTRAHELRDAFTAAGLEVGCFFAMKSNNHPAVAQTLAEIGYGLDVSSGLELETALGTSAREIVFSGPGKTEPELQLAVRNAARVTVLVDSFSELERLDRMAAAEATRVSVGVRLTTTPTGLWRKFGIGLDELPDFWERSRRAAGIRFAGVQFHASWNLDPAAQVELIQRLGEALGRAPEGLIRAIRFIDIGGGYWPADGEWLQHAATPEGKLLAALGETTARPLTHYRLPATPIREFAARIGSAVDRHLRPILRCRICVEPGRFVCHEAMHLLITVVDQKGPDLVITDAGTNAVGWERFESDYFPVINLTRPAAEERPCHVLGSLCTPHDVWGYAYFGADLRVGDVLLLPNQGAYTYSLRQHFIKPLPAVVKI
ncbi:MAG: alanine racemase [bacterium]